jgi:hypothetical protein
MQRILVSISLSLALAAPVAAQCLDVSSPGTSIGTGDDTLFTTHYALGFAFPMAGSANGTYSHFRVCTNGWIILTDGVTTPSGAPGTTNYGSSTTLAGSTAGNSPRIAPYWRDMNVVAPGGIYYDNTTNAGVSATISFVDTRDFNVVPTKSYQIELFATGDIKLSYSTGMNVVQSSPAYVGVSRGNGQTATAAADVSAGVATAGAGMFWQSFATGTFDLGGTSIFIVPDGGGGWNAAKVCEGASHQNYGVGCYDIPSGTAYQFFADTALANPVLTGNALSYTKTGTGYVLTWVPGGAAAFITPGGGATNFANSDDGSTVLTPSVPFAGAGGAATQLAIAHNGHATMAATVNHGTDWTPTGAEVATASNQNRAFYGWHDYNNNEVGSGPIQWEELTIGPDQVLCVTWNGVENYPTTVVNPTTMQMQFNLTTGDALILWVSVATDITPATGTAHLIGYSGQGSSADPGSTDFSLGPVQVAANAITPPTLSASPAPTFTLGGSSVPMTWQADNLRDASPAAPGVYVGLLIFSVTGPIGGTGIDLSLVGIDAPGCPLLVGSLDVTFGLAGVTSTLTQPITMPQPLSPGDTFYSQVANFIVPNSLPGGLNNFGTVMTNGVKSYFNTF